MKSCVLAIDNDAIFLSGFRLLVENAEVELDTATSGREGIELLLQSPDKYRAVILDYEMPGMNGDAVARRLKEINPKLKIIMLSGTEDEDVVKACHSAGAERFLLKAQDSQKILESLNSVIFNGEIDEVEIDDTAELISSISKIMHLFSLLANYHLSKIVLF